MRERGGGEEEARGERREWCEEEEKSEEGGVRAITRDALYTSKIKNEITLVTMFLFCKRFVHGFLASGSRVVT